MNLELTIFLALLGLGQAVPAGELAPAAVPSGREVTLTEVIWEPDDGGRLRLRFLAPWISRDAGLVDFDEVGADMAYLCDTVALPLLAREERSVGRIIVSLSDRAVAFGSAAPEATQFFDIYRLQDGACVWEAF